LVVDSQGNIFASGNGGILYEVNPMNATSTLIGDTGEGNSLFAETFVGSTLYGFSSPDNITDTVVTIDSTTAAVTMGPTINLASGYAVVAAAAPLTTAVPEPSSLLLASVGGLVVFSCGLMKARGRVERSRCRAGGSSAIS
jgi:hypothetical protein